jgi:hypothetical protein
VNRHIRIAATIVGLAVFAPRPTPAQEGTAKPRLELADSVNHPKAVAAKTEAGPRERAAGIDKRVEPVPGAPRPAVPTAGAATTPAAAPPTSGEFRPDFVRNQTILGAAIYAPALATTITSNGLAWGAAYLLVTGGSYVAAAEVSREMKVTDPMQTLATWAPVHGAAAAWVLSNSAGLNRQGTAAVIAGASLGGTALALWKGRDMNANEAAATLAGGDVGALTAFGVATAAGLGTNGGSNQPRLLVTVGGMLAGAPLGHAYAALAPYHVTRGDLLAMGATSGIGMLAGLAVVANDPNPGDRKLATALTVGGVAGLVAGDRLFTSRYDHSEGDGTLMIGGALAGGLMGAGVAALTGASTSRWTTSSAIATTVGAAAGLAWSQYYLRPKADGAMQLGRLELNPAGFVGAATGAAGTYTLGTIRF